ncbi:LysR family transcriptional regulator [Caenimonas koreensis DSM 17982]|uniref:LysR family transcriptional regulator n=1 Tax=Caenimonas koreensis DSM 17982 TaxID=1121255 RepID=A0A844B9K0_9BURK|nr:LysR family transcriptional regulator [Caenimonas koreensis]MRD48279.1 LysR family transcriptional regulator [Caenimonas koreensis DSM 17982]
MDKFKAMQTFVQIADEGSLTAAARQMGSSLPAVVRALAAYEAALGVRLFNRTTRRISLTEEGKLHLENSRQVLAALEESEASLTAGATEPAGHLTITAPVLFGQMHVAPCVTRFVQQHDKMRCSLVLLDRVVNLLEEGIDLGIRIGTLEDSSLVSQPLGHIRRVVVATPAYLRKHGTPKHPRDLQRFNCIRNLSPAQQQWGDFQESGRTFRVAVKGNLEFNHVLPAVQACAAGAGFGMFFSYQVAPYLATRQLKIVLESFERPARPISIVYPHARLLPARTRVFIDWIRNDLTAFRQGPLNTTSRAA